MYTTVKICCLCFLACLLLSITTPAPTAAREASLTVRILIYSGRPDPTYVLTREALRKARPFLQKARRSMKHAKGEEATIIPSILGYKGILVTNPTNIEGLPKRFAVYDGKIESLGKKRTIFPDPGRNLERFLLREAVAQGVIDEMTLRKIIVEERERPDEDDSDVEH